MSNVAFLFLLYGMQKNIRTKAEPTTCKLRVVSQLASDGFFAFF